MSDCASARVGRTEQTYRAAAATTIFDRSKGQTCSKPSHLGNPK